MNDHTEELLPCQCGASAELRNGRVNCSADGCKNAGLFTDLAFWNKHMREQSLHQRIAALEAENGRITRQRDAILLQARCWAGEAKAQQSITKEVGEILGGIPSWGPIAAEVRKLLDAATPAQEVLQEAQVMGRVHHNPDHAEPVRAVLNSIGRLLPDNAPLYTTPQPGPDVRALVAVSINILGKLQHPTACVNAMDMWKLEDALKPFTAHRQAQQGEQP